MGRGRAQPSQHSSTPLLHFFSSGVLHYFFNGCITVKNTTQAVFAQRDHAELDGLLPEHDRRGAFVDERANGIVDDQQLENAFTAFVSSIVAGGASAPVVKHLIPEVVR